MMSVEQEKVGHLPSADAAVTACSSPSATEPAAQSRPSGFRPTGAQSIADILDKAADLIEPEGAWTQGFELSGKDGCHCAATAIEAVVHEVSEPELDAGLDAYDAFEPMEFFAQIVGFRQSIWGTIWYWNDAPERTQAEVVAKLREASAKAREAGL